MLDTDLVNDALDRPPGTSPLDIESQGDPRVAPLRGLATAITVASVAELDASAWAAASQGDYHRAQRLLALAVASDATDWRRFRALSGYLVATGDFAAAREHAEKAVQLAPAEEWEPPLHLGVILDQLRQHAEAVRQLTRAAALNPAIGECFQQLAWAAEQLGRLELAASLALKAFRLDPGSHARARYAAHLLVLLGHKREALDLMRKAAEGGDPDPHLRSAIASLLLELGDEEAAADEFDALIRSVGGDSGLKLHISYLMSRLGRHDRAVELLEEALREEPENQQFKRHAVTLYLAAGRSGEAVSAAGDLLRLAPDDPEYVSCIKHVLRVREGAGSIVPSRILLAKRAATARRLAPRRSMADAAATQARVIWALLLRETRTRYGESRLGYSWALAELAIHIGVLAIVFPFTMHGRPPIGDSFFFFYFTGLIPYLLFSHVAGQVGAGLIHNKALLQLPQVTHFDVLFARGLLEFVAILAVALLFMGGFLVMGVDAVPNDPGAALSAVLSAWLFALGIGSANAVINTFTHAWEHAFSVILRLLYFGSGIFYVPSMMPEWFRNILAWNPLLQDVDWFRTAFFSTYRPEWLVPSYSVAAAFVAALLGLSLEAAFRKQIQLAQ